MDFLSDIGRMNKRQVLLQTINLGAARCPDAQGLCRQLCRCDLVQACSSAVPSLAEPKALCMLLTPTPCSRHDHHQCPHDLEVAGAGDRLRVAGASLACCRSKHVVACRSRKQILCFAGWLGRCQAAAVAAAADLGY